MVMMICAAVVNAVLDPLFIFGGMGISPMGIEGAAYATVVSRFVGMLIIFGVLMFRDKMIDLSLPKYAELLESCRRILSVGLPAILSNVMGPLATGLLTSLVAVYGAEALAAYGIGARVDALLLIIPGALTGALSPFIGQNFGAHLNQRVAKGIRISLNFVIVYGLISLAVLVTFSESIAGLFSDDAKVVDALSLYLMVIPIGYAASSTVRVATSAFNAVDHAFRSTLISLLQSIFIAVPAAWICSQFLGLEGVFLGLVIAAFGSSLLGIRWPKSLLNPDEEPRPDKVEPIDLNASIQLLSDQDMSELLASLIPEVLKLEDVQMHQVRADATGFFVGSRELAHIHQRGRIDLPLPLEVGENLIRLNIVEHHPLHDNGWYVHQMHSSKEIEQTIWLLFLAHSLYEIRKRGADDPLTQAELDRLSVSEQCRSSIISSTERWGVPVQEVG